MLEKNIYVYYEKWHVSWEYLPVLEKNMKQQF